MGMYLCQIYEREIETGRIDIEESYHDPPEYISRETRLSYEREGYEGDE